MTKRVKLKRLLSFFVYSLIWASGHLIKLNHLQKQKKVGACQSHQEQYFKSYLYKTNKRKLNFFIASKYANDSYFTLRIGAFFSFWFYLQFQFKTKIEILFPFQTSQTSTFKCQDLFGYDSFV